MKRNAEITLPWFDKSLSPNGRSHWAKKAKAAKKSRQDGFMAARLAGYNKQTFAGHEGKIVLSIKFYPKTKAMPDDDNCLGGFKAYRDGIADALGVDDRRFLSRPVVMDEVGGVIKVVLNEEKMRGA